LCEPAQPVKTVGRKAPNSVLFPVLAVLFGFGNVWVKYPNTSKNQLFDTQIPAKISFLTF
jgi:hypothetical protein